MKSKIANRILVGILIVSLVFQVKIPAVYAANSANTPKVDSITNSVCANGVPLLIEEGSNGKTKIKYYDGNNYVDWMEGNYEYYQVYGGTGFGYVNEAVQSASITMTGGKVSRIYGGGKGKVNVKGNVKGDANVTISGGTVALVLCGGESSSIGGNATITITGGNISTAVQLGGSEYDKIEGNANITITGGTVKKLGKGTYSTILGKKTGIITTTMVDAALFDNGFLKTGDNSYIAKGTITLPPDFDFILPTGATLTVQEGAVITNQGKITLKSTMVNNGTFTNNGTVKNEGGSYSGSGTWNGTAMEDLKLTLSTAKEITDSSAKVAVNCNKDATIYYLASETPISDISILETKGKAQSISANTDCDIALDNLNGNTAYTYYMVAKAGETFTDIKTVSFTTLQKSTNLQLTGTVSGKVFDDTPISHSTTKGDLFTWDSDGIISFTYFTDNAGTKTTAANSGAVSEGAAPKNAGIYYVKAIFSDNGGYVGAESDYIPFTITKSATEFTDGIKTYKDNTATNTFNYGDTITVKVTPKATGTKPAKNGLRMARSFSAPTANQMALFVGNTQITEPQTAASGQELTFTYNTTDTNVITPDTPVDITAKYVGNANMADYEQSTKVTVNAVAKVTKGITESYAGTLQGAFDLIGNGETGTIKMLKDIDLGENGVKQTGGSTVTFDLNGYTVTHSKSGGSAITIYSPDTTKLIVKSSVDGGILLETGKSSSAINNAIGKGEVIIESGLIRNTGSVGGKAIYNANKLIVNGGILDTLRNGFSIMNAESAATLEVNGGIVKSVSEAIFNKYGTVSINGGTILSDVAINNWANCTVNYTKGIILGDCTGEGTYVGSNPQWSAKGNVILPISAEIPSGKTFTVDENAVLTIANGASLNNNGTLLLNGKINGTGTLSGTGEFKTTEFTADDIQAIPNQAYTGSAIKPAISINPKTIMGKKFTIDISGYTGPTYQKQSSTETWDNVDNDSILNVGTYRAVYTKISDNSTVAKEFTIAKANGRITIKNDYKVSYPYTGNTITEPVESQIDKLGDGKVTFQWYDGKNEDGTVTGLTKRETAPVEVGTYTLQAIVAETTNYKSASTTAVVTITEPEYIISAASKDTTGADTNATLTGLGSYVSGTLVTVEASIVSGYNFVGWYQASKEAPGYTGDILSKNHVYKFTISKNTDLVAVYKPLGTASITVNGGNSYTINDSQYTAPNTGTYSLGTNVTVAVSDVKDFAYWVNDYGKVVSRKAAYTFSVTGSMTLTAVYNKKVENKSTVIFESYYGQVMSRMQLGSGDTVTLPKGPTRYGYTFIKWSMTAEEIQKGIKENTAVIRVTPVYKLINQSYTIKVTGGAGSRNYNLNDLVTATANAPEAGKKFSHWTDADGNILSYSTTYQFYAAKDATIIANYVADTTVVEAKGTAEIINIDKDTEKSKIIFVSMVTVPEGCKIQMAGIIGTDNKAVGTSGDGFNKDTAAYVRGNAWSGNAYRFTWTKKVSADETWYVRAYLVYKDTNGNLITVYGDMITAKL